MKTLLYQRGAWLLTSILVLGAACPHADAQAAGQAAGGQTGAGQAAAGQLPPTGVIPPRDPRLQAPNIQDTAPPPPIVTPPPPNPNPDATSRLLGVDEAVRIGLQLQPNIAIASAALKIQKGRTIQTRANLQPQVSVNAGYDYITAISTITGVPSQSTGFTGSGDLHQLIYDFNHTRDLVSQNVQLEKAANAGIVIAKFNTVFAVKSAFYAYVENLKLVKVNEEDVANTQGQYNLALARYNTGIGLPSDVVTASTAKEAAITGLISARQAAEAARVNLALQMGIDARTPIDPADSTERTPATRQVNDLTDRALEKRPEVVQAQANLRSALYGVKAARTTNAPTITGNVEITSAGNALFPQSDNLLIGINLNWTPIDGGFTRGAVVSAQGSVDSAAAQLSQTQLSVKSDVNNAYTLLVSAEQRLVSTQADVANAEEGVRIATGRYATGIGQFLDILTAQQLLLTARTEQVVAQEDLQTARATLQHAVGDINP